MNIKSISVLYKETHVVKYSHFEKDITEYITKIIPFKIGSRGYMTSENKDH